MRYNYVLNLEFEKKLTKDMHSCNEDKIVSNLNIYIILCYITQFKGPLTKDSYLKERIKPLDR